MTTGLTNAPPEATPITTSDPVEPYPGELVIVTSGHDLCAQVSFRKVPYYRMIDGERVAYTRLVSTYKSTVVNEKYDARGFLGDDCRHTRADFVADFGRGESKVQVHSGKHVSNGGFGLSRSGYVRGYVCCRLRGTPVVLTTMTDCREVLAAEAGTQLDEDCYFDYGERDCYYCTPRNDHDGPCAIGDGVPCGRDSSGRIVYDYNVSFPPGLPVYGRFDSSWDISGVRFGSGRIPARLGDGFREKVLYILKGLDLLYNPSVPEVHDYCITDSDWCCHIVIHNSSGGQHYRLICVEPVRTSTNTRLRQDIFHKSRYFFVGGDGLPVFVHASLTFQSPCFQLIDQQCYTAGRPSERNKPDEVPYLWEHSKDGEAILNVLDSVHVDLRMRIADDAEHFPRNEPECVVCANDVLAAVRTLGMEQLPFSGRTASRFVAENNEELNHWFHGKNWRGTYAPTVAKSSAGGSPWLLDVKLYREGVSCPAELVIKSAKLSLRISGESALIRVPGGGANGVRVSALFDAEIELAARLKPDPDNDDHARLVELIGDDDGFARTARPGEVVIFAVDNPPCSRVPLRVKWRGLVGPSPWSSAKWEFNYLGPNANNCCRLLYAIDGLVIPGEVNRTTDPRGVQGMDGTVVVTLNIDPDDIC